MKELDKNKFKTLHSFLDYVVSFIIYANSNINIITNAQIGAFLQDYSEFISVLNTSSVSLTAVDVFNIGSINNNNIYVDTKLNWNDNNIHITPKDIIENYSNDIIETYNIKL